MIPEGLRLLWEIQGILKVLKTWIIICESIFYMHPDYPDLQVSVSSDEMSERVAKARLMQRMYELGTEKGIEPKRLRFKINGIEE